MTEPTDDPYIYVIVYPYEVTTADLFPDDGDGSWAEDVENWLTITSTTGTDKTGVTINCGDTPFAFPKRSRKALQVKRLRATVFPDGEMADQVGETEQPPEAYAAEEQVQ